MEINSSDILLLVVQVTNIILCYSMILQAKISKHSRIFLVYIGILLISLVNRYCNMGINMTLMGNVYCLLIPLVLVEKNKIKCVLLYPCAFMMIYIFSTASSFMFAIILGISRNEVLGTIKIATNMIFTAVFGGVFMYKKRCKNKKASKLYWNNSMYIAVTVGTIFFYMLVEKAESIGRRYSILVVDVNVLGLLISVVCILFFGFFLWLSSTIYYNEIYNKENDMLNLYIKEQEKHMELIVEKDMCMRKFRHDIREHMWIISRYVENGDYQQLQKYIDTVYGKFNESNLTSYTGIVPIDAVITHKKLIMEQKGIRFEWCGCKDKMLDKFEVYDLCTLFSNILNNAIEACEKLDDADKLIKIVVDFNRDRLYIKGSNIIKNSVELDKDGNPVSTKQDKNNHGYGCKNIRTVVRKYEGEIEFFVNDGIFVVEIIL